MGILGFKTRQGRALIGGVLGLIVGFWMIFIVKDNLGFIPGILGALLLVFGGRR